MRLQKKPYTALQRSQMVYLYRTYYMYFEKWNIKKASGLDKLKSEAEKRICNVFPNGIGL